MKQKPLAAEEEEVVQVVPTLYDLVKSKDWPGLRKWFGQC